MKRRNVKVGDVKDVNGEVNIAGGNIIKNIKTIYQRTLTATEEAANDRKIEGKLLAQGVSLLVRNLSSQASQSIESGSPYKGLLSYNLNEAEIFFGRNEAKLDLLKCIKQDPLTVLHAESGAGKSSLLQAGIAAHLIANGHLAIRLRSHNADPVEFIKRTFLNELSQAPSLTDASLREFLRQVCEVLGPNVNLYLLLDQFEEFFNLLTKEERKPFLESLADCLNDMSLKVRWVLGLRAEALSELAELESFGIAPFKNLYRLNRLSRMEALEAIIGPANLSGIIFEPALINHILDTLTTNNEITPTQLQLVCSALTDDLPEDKTLSLSYYSDHEGGTEGILRDYLRRQVEHLPFEEQAYAWKVLRSLITADRLRAVKTHDEVIEELRLSGISKEQIDTLLTRLVERRLLATQLTVKETFELAHDYLIKEIELDPQEQALKAAQELLDQETRTYQRHKTLLTAERLAVIEPHRAELLLSVEAETLLDRSQAALEESLRKEMAARKRRQQLAATAILLIIAALLGWGFTSMQHNSQLKAERLYAQSLLSQDTIDDRKFLLWAQMIRDIPEARFGLFVNYSPIKQRVIPKDGGWIYSMDINPERNLLATGRQNGMVNLWDVSTERIVQTLQGPDAVVHHVEFGPNGDLLAASFANDPQASVFVWHIPDGKLLFSIDTQARWAKSITFTPDQNLMAISLDSYDKIQVWDITETKQLLSDKPLVELHLSGRAASISFSPQGNLLAAGLISPLGNTILLWDTTNWQVVCEFSESKDWIFSLSFNQTGDLLASGGRDDRVGLWNPQSCTRVGLLEGHTDDIQSVNFSPDGRYVVSSSFDNTIRIWSVQEQIQVGLPLKGHKTVVQNALFGKDNNVLISGGLDNSVIFWDLYRQNSIGEKILDQGGELVDVLLDTKSSTLFALTQDGQIHRWDTSNDQSKNIPISDLNNLPAKKISLSLDGKLLGIVDDEGLQIVQIDTGNLIAKFPVKEGLLINTMSFTPNGKQIFAGGNLNQLMVYDIASGAVREFNGPESDPSIDIQKIVLSPSGRYFATGNKKGTITLWDTASLTPVMSQIQAHDDWITDLIFNSDETTLASAGYEGAIKLWDGQTLEPIGLPLLGGHKGAVLSLTFTLDQKALISGGMDNSIVWWSLETYMVIGKFNTWDTSPVTHILLSSDNQSIISGSRAGNIYLWRMNPDQLVSYACQVAGRNFTQSEWKQFFPSEKYKRTCSQWPEGQ